MSTAYTSSHLANLALHVAAGGIGIAFGMAILWRPKGTLAHKAAGRWFALCVGVVCATAALGNVLFGFRPLFATLALLVGYQLVSGLRVARTRERGPDVGDALLTVLTCGAAAWLSSMIGLAQAPVARSTLAALFVLLAYDTLRLFFPHRWRGTLWRYEHVYKMVACLFGMISAASGNLLAAWQPWSQLLPSVAGMGVIIAQWWSLRRRAKSGSPAHHPAPASAPAYPQPSPSSSR